MHILKRPLIYLVQITLLLCFFQNSHGLTTPIQIALAGPLTGPYAAYGSSLLAGAMQAVNDINAAGGINGVPLEIMPFDDQCDPDLAIRRADEIISADTYKAVIGHVCSAASLATAKFYSHAKLLVVTPTATNPKITQQNIDTIFRISGNDEQQSIAAANFIAYTLKSERIAVLHDDELYSKGLADLVAENLLYLNAAPALYQVVPRGTKNFTALVKKLKQLNVDAIYFAGMYPEVAALVNALYTLELQIPVISGDGIAIEDFVKDAGDLRAANAVLLTFSTDPHQLVSSQNLLQAMRENNFSTNGYALYAYAAVQTVAAAMRNTNQLDGAALAKWLHYNSVDTVLGKKSWNTNGDITDHEFKIYNWQLEKNNLSLHLLR